MPWYACTVKSAETPLALGFSQEQECWLGELPSYRVLFNDTQIRFLTERQVSVHVEKGRELGDLTKLLADLQRRLLRSPTGMLVDLHRVPREYPLPAGLPAEYLGCPVHVVDVAPAVNIGEWEADWWPVYETGKRKIVKHIYYKRDWLMDLIHAKAWPLILDTRQHEYVESGLSLMCAQVMWPEANPRQLCGLALAFGGYTHLHTIDLVDGYAGPQAEARYDKDDMATIRMLSPRLAQAEEKL
ncbi:MAG: hypothetical protein KGL39_06925 [Patescibacteria group bacterium]|nr:hypothetical protein [Patescibacteria group bacterium]